MLYLYGFYADELKLVLKQGWEDYEEDAGVSRAGHDWKCECYYAVGIWIHDERETGGERGGDKGKSGT